MSMTSNHLGIWNQIVNSKSSSKRFFTIHTWTVLLLNPSADSVSRVCYICITTLGQKLNTAFLIPLLSSCKSFIAQTSQIVWQSNIGYLMTQIANLCSNLTLPPAKKERKIQRKKQEEEIYRKSHWILVPMTEKFPSGLRLCGQVSSQINPLSDFGASLELKERSNLNCFQMSNPKKHCYSTPNLVRNS